MSKHLEGRSPIKFFALVFAYSWGLWLPIIFITTGKDLGSNVLSIVVLLEVLGGFAPLAAALTLVVRKHGWKESWQFVRQVFDFRTKPMYYLLALVVPLIIHASAHYLAPLFNLEVADTLIPADFMVGVPRWVLAIPYFLFIGMLGGGQEEFGWRGYAQQPLQERFGVLRASLLIGLVWGIFHLPLWFIPGDPHSTQPFPAFVIQTVSVSLVYALLYNASGQKLIIPVLFHAMWNTAPPLFPFLHMIEGKPETAYWVYAGVNVLAGLIAAYFIKKRFGVQEVNEL